MSLGRWSEGDAEALAAAGLLLLRDPPSREQAASDFGQLCRGDAWAVAVPRDPAELEQIVRYAAGQALPLTPRGRGLSQSGQSLPTGGVTLDLGRLDRIAPVEAARRRVRCEAGARLREVVAATLPHGLLPAVLPLHLDMSVGGLLSAGGIGANSHALGPLGSHALELEVVTPARGLQACDRERNADLHAAALAGLGRCGVIARATLALRPVASRVRTFHLLYASPAPWMADQRLLLDERRADYLEGFCWSSAKGTRTDHGARRPFQHWLYGLQVGIEYDEAPPAPTAALAGLQPLQVVHVEDEPIASHVHRYQPRFEGMRRSGAWAQPHPWLECFLAAEQVPDLLPRILERLPPALSDGHRVLWVAQENLPPFLAMPAQREQGVLCLAFLPAGVAPGEREEVLRGLGEVDVLLRAAGGKRYLSGWLGSMDERRWREHHGERHQAWQEAKQRFDPQGILRSTLFP